MVGIGRRGRLACGVFLITFLWAGGLLGFFAALLASNWLGVGVFGIMSLGFFLTAWLPMIWDALERN